MKPFTVADLIKYLQQQPQDLPLAYALHSEYCLLELRDIQVMSLAFPRVDGWIHNFSPSVPQQKYLVFPGN